MDRLAYIVTYAADSKGWPQEGACVHTSNDSIESGLTDTLYDAGRIRKDTKPTSEWMWSNGRYEGNFDIYQYTYTNFYFSGNDNGDIYYSITGSSPQNKICRVQGICKTCNDKVITTYEFLPSSIAETPAHRIIWLNSCEGHYIYFKIISNDGWGWEENNLSGTIWVSDQNNLQ
jgi:hypothetical protein